MFATTGAERRELERKLYILNGLKTYTHTIELIKLIHASPTFKYRSFAFKLGDPQTIRERSSEKKNDLTLGAPCCIYIHRNEISFKWILWQSNKAFFYYIILLLWSHSKWWKIHFQFQLGVIVKQVTGAHTSVKRDVGVWMLTDAGLRKWKRSGLKEEFQARGKTSGLRCVE